MTSSSDRLTWDVPDVHGLQPNPGLIGTIIHHIKRDRDYLIVDFAWLGATDEWGYVHAVRSDSTHDVHESRPTARVCRPLHHLYGSTSDGTPRYSLPFTMDFTDIRLVAERLVTKHDATRHETDAQFVARYLRDPDPDLLRLVQLCRREHHSDATPMGEELHQQYREECAVEHADEPPQALTDALSMLDRWTREAQPASANGQITFTRAIMESVADAIRHYLGGKS